MTHSSVPHHAVSTALGSLSELLAADTSVTLASLDVMDKLNRSAIDRYSKLTQAAEGLDNDREYLKSVYAEIEKYTKQVDSIEHYVDDLEQVTKELDEWSRELEVKSRRYARR
ncbi:hypothetical protein NADFUDRAFT_47948 [Nadsonia fulvescens var. elongata DSM 6958]|uniref:Biogenesis of lysosome-related organelles complex 1 subunit 2 n=1 Tax=Nadsonia fulvescens var. elongata DSM 6958 TaxID=857566 RepID=A0A1E3PE50_9ASCO|nr:hypothetical protein NADFUDRAFT_47948 [Nadsonia fulvescens var. elongata DSM 6958]